MSAASESVTLRVHAEQIADAYQHREMRIGAPSQLGDPDVLQLLLAAISDGVDYERACKSAGISPRTIYNWKNRADHGDEAARAFVQALEMAEADVERRATRNTLRAGEFPQFWAANMTFLERRYPERWGRRQSESDTPKVIVQIGARDSDVQVTFASVNTSLSPEIHSLTEAHSPESNNPDYVNLQVVDNAQVVTNRAAAVIDAGQPDQASGRAIRPGTLPGGRPSSARRGRGQGKGGAGVGKGKRHE